MIMRNNLLQMTNLLRTKKKNQLMTKQMLHIKKYYCSNTDLAKESLTFTPQTNTNNNCIVWTPSPRTPPPLSAGEGGRGLSLLTIFQKGGRRCLTGSQFLEGGCWERGGVFVINKLKSEIFNNKKSLYTEMFFSVLTKNLN